MKRIILILSLILPGFVFCSDNYDKKDEPKTDKQREQNSKDLYDAACFGDLDKAREIIGGKNFDIDYKSTKYTTTSFSALGTAAHNGHAEIVKLLLACKPDIKLVKSAISAIEGSIKLKPDKKIGNKKLLEEYIESIEKKHQPILKSIKNEGFKNFAKLIRDMK